MVAWVAWGERFSAEERCVGGVRVLVLSLRRGWWGRYDAHRAARLLSRAGVRHAAFPEAFAFLPLFAARGISPAPQTPLREARAAALLRLCLRQRALRPETLVLCGASPSRVLTDAARTLCARMRYVQLDLDAGGGGLAARLWCELGVSPRLVPAPPKLCANEAALLFAPRDIDPGAGLVLPLYDDALRVTWRVRGETLDTPRAAALFNTMGIDARDFVPVNAEHLTGVI